MYKNNTNNSSTKAIESSMVYSVLVFVIYPFDNMFECTFETL